MFSGLYTHIDQNNCKTTNFQHTFLCTTSLNYQNNEQDLLYDFYFNTTHRESVCAVCESADSEDNSNTQTSACS